MPSHPAGTYNMSQIHTNLSFSSFIHAQLDAATASIYWHAWRERIGSTRISIRTLHQLEIQASDGKQLFSVRMENFEKEQDVVRARMTAKWGAHHYVQQMEAPTFTGSKSELTQERKRAWYRNETLCHILRVSCRKSGRDGGA